MKNIGTEKMWVDVIEDIPGLGCNTTTIRLNGPLRAEETIREWLESQGYCDIIDYRIVVGDWVMLWTAPESEWVWIQNMTERYVLPSQF